MFAFLGRIFRKKEKPKQAASTCSRPQSRPTVSSRIEETSRNYTDEPFLPVWMDSSNDDRTPVHSSHDSGCHSSSSYDSGSSSYDSGSSSYDSGSSSYD